MSKLQPQNSLYLSHPSPKVFLVLTYSNVVRAKCFQAATPLDSCRTFDVVGFLVIEQLAGAISRE